MQTINSYLCPRCGEPNSRSLPACPVCGEPAAGRQLPPRVSTPPPFPSDVVPLIWALACCFLAVWGLVAAGPLRPLLSILTHPYVLIAASVFSLILTGIYLAERASRERRPQALLSTRDVMALSWTAAALLGSSQLLKYVLPPAPVISRYQVVQGSGDGCRVEVYIHGEEGDELWRLTGLGREPAKQIVGIIVRRPGGGSARLPLTEHTPAGDCAITKYHLLVNGKETDQIDGAVP